MKINDIKNKSVLFITTKELDYIRNTQEIRILRENNNVVECMASNNRNYFVRIFMIYFKLLQLKVDIYDLIFIGFAPQLILPIWNRKFRNKTIFIDFFISFYDTLVFDRKKIKKNSILATWLKKIDNSTLHYADYVIGDTKIHGDYFVKELGLEKEKLSILYLEADKTIYYPRESKKSAHLRNKKVILYFGSILPLQGVDIVLKAIHFLKDDNTMHFQIVGPISARYDKPKGNNIEYISWLSQKELAEYIANADLCLAGHFAKNIEKANRTIPGKAYIYHMMGKKMILGDSEANREVFKNENTMIQFVELGNYQQLIEAIRNNHE